MTVALYRKYRSRDFDEVVGQNHVTKSLANALKRGRISHAYLFCGPHGVGKTSTARILARHINKLAPDAINHLDIIEIDAASNRRIDEIRDLRDKVHTAPASAPYKVYIIDEVHMLTKEAFNALLKTLEEPPKHVVFILATTEAHKLPETIISRTQRFNFTPLTTEQVKSHLELIAQKEGYTYEAGALTYIAQASKGSLRDSLSTLEQLANLSDGNINVTEVTALLGLVPSDIMQQLLDAIVSSDAATVIKKLDYIKAIGTDAVQFINQFCLFCHELIRQYYLNNGPLPTNLPVKIILQSLGRLTNVAAVKNYGFLAIESILLELSTKSDTAPVNVSSSAANRTKVNKLNSSKQIVMTPSQPNRRPVVTRPEQFSEDMWLRALSEVKQNHNALYALLRIAKPKLNDGKLEIHFRFLFHKRRFEEAKNRQLFEKAISKVLKHDIPVVAVYTAGTDSQSTSDTIKHQDKAVLDQVINILGGEVVNGSQ